MHSRKQKNNWKNSNPDWANDEESGSNQPLKEAIAMAERKVICYIAQSLDGYIADPEETLDWLLDVEMDGDAGYGQFIGTVDTILLGRRTYEWVVSHESGEFPYVDQRS